MANTSKAETRWMQMCLGSYLFYNSMKADLQAIFKGIFNAKQPIRTNKCKPHFESNSLWWKLDQLESAIELSAIGLEQLEFSD